MQESTITGKVLKEVESISRKLAGSDIKKKQRLIDNVVVFMGAAGGVGTSTLMANVAHKVQGDGLSVLIMDLNVLYPIQHNYHGVEQKVNRGDLLSFLSGKISIGDAMSSKDNTAVIFSNNRSIIDKINSDNKGCSDILSNTLGRCRSLFDLVLIDCSHYDIDYDVVNTALYEADAIYLVWDENVACISNTDKIQRNLTVSGIENSQKLRVILNKRTDIAYPERIIEELGTRLVSTIPYDKAVIECGLNGKIFSKSGASFSRSSAVFCTEMDELAKKIIRDAGYRG